MLRILILIAAMLAGASGEAWGQGVVIGVSDPVVVIHSAYTGQGLTIFGNVEAGAGAVPAGPYDVIVVVRGPGSTRVVSAVGRQSGLVTQTARMRYADLPGFYAALSSRPLAALFDPGRADDPSLTLGGVAARARVDADGAGFDAELVRLMEAAGLFQGDDHGVTFISPTSFAARVALPANAPNGAYLARAYAVAGGQIVATAETSFLVRTAGFERLLARLANDMPIAYGLAAVATAIATGWIGGVLFRR